jgi:L-ribulose-5-phosphate 3-epimerase
MRSNPIRRRFLRTAAALGAGTIAAGTLGLGRALAAAKPRPSSLDPANPAVELPESTGEHRGRIFKSIKFGMFNEGISIAEKFRLMKEMGYDGAELNSPGGENKKEALEASLAHGLPIHGAVDSIHWGTRLSDPDPAVRERGLAGLLTAIEETSFCRGSAVLLVPGRVANAEHENHDQVWERSIEQIRKALPLASRLGIRILIENVWNGFCYVHDGPADQSADLLAKYIDEIDSPWVGVYFDIGNHQKYGKPADWIRRLRHRIVKLDVKDWGKSNGFSKIGEGDVDWADVRKALGEIRYTGWATAEVEGGNREKIREIADRMHRVLGL